LHWRIQTGVIGSSVCADPDHATQRTIEAIWRVESARVIAGLKKSVVTAAQEETKVRIQEGRPEKALRPTHNLSFIFASCASSTPTPASGNTRRG
jgi:hypothetical protein